MVKQSKYKRITITLPHDLLNKFRKYCKENAINMSGKIAKLIDKEIHNK